MALLLLLAMFLVAPVCLAQPNDQGQVWLPPSWVFGSGYTPSDYSGSMGSWGYDPFSYYNYQGKTYYPYNPYYYYYPGSTSYPYSYSYWYPYNIYGYPYAYWYPYNYYSNY